MDGNRHHPYHLDSPASANGDPDHITTSQLQRLVHLLDDSDVSEIEVKRADVGMHLVLRKARASNGEVTGVFQEVVVPMEVDEPEPAPVDTQHTVVAPLVGIFHTWAKPKGKDLVAVGDRVKVGQRLGTIQSLNVLNEVESPVAGRVVEILAPDGQAVEYGQPLLILDSAEGA